MLYRLGQWFRLQHNALAAAKGPVVHRPVPVMRELPQIVHRDLQQTGLDGALDHSMFKDAGKKTAQQKPSFLPKTWKAGRDVPVQQELPAPTPAPMQAAPEPAPRPQPNIVHQVAQTPREREVVPEVQKDDLDVPTFLRRQATQKA